MLFALVARPRCHLNAEEAGKTMLAKSTRLDALNLLFRDRMSRFPGRYCITECGTILARKKQYSEKHPSIREHEDKNLP